MEDVNPYVLGAQITAEGQRLEVHIRADGPGAYHRKHLLALIGAIRGEIISQGLFTEPELTALTGALERHIDAPSTLVTRPLLFQAWGRKPP